MKEKCARCRTTDKVVCQDLIEVNDWCLDCYDKLDKLTGKLIEDFKKNKKIFFYFEK